MSIRAGNDAAESNESKQERPAIKKSRFRKLNDGDERMKFSRRCRGYGPQADHTCNSSLGVELEARVIGDVHPDVHVRHAAEVPDERGPFDAPHVPFAIVSQVG